MKCDIIIPCFGTEFCWDCCCYCLRNLIPRGAVEWNNRFDWIFTYVLFPFNNKILVYFSEAFSRILYRFHSMCMYFMLFFLLFVWVVKILEIFYGNNALCNRNFLPPHCSLIVRFCTSLFFCVILFLLLVIFIIFGTSFQCITFEAL